MRKSKINLLVNREDYKKYEKYFYWTRISVIIMAVLFIISSAYFFITAYGQSTRLNSLLSEKQTMLTASKNNKTNEAKMILLAEKYRSLKEFLQDDANSLPYYNLLNSALSMSSQSASLKSFQINKDRETNFAVSFSNFDELMSFFRFVESESFLKNFEKVTLNSFTAVGGTENKKNNYELNFNGKFIIIK